MLKLLLFIMLDLVLYSNVFAADVFSFILPSCRIILGLPLDRTDAGLVILTTEGKIEKIDPEELSGLAQYVVPQSPYQNMQFPLESIPYLKQMSLKESNQTIVGFPYYFTEDVIFVLDSHGRRLVIGEEELGRTTSHDHFPVHKKSEAPAVDLKLALPAGLEECKTTEGIMPVRLSTDKVQVLEHVSAWEEGFKKINDLAERTDFYPRPQMFEGDDRVGLFVYSMPDGEETVLPLRVRIVNGVDFGFQGETFFGGGLERTGPRALPLEMFSTELKFHFLHALFVGNLKGMAMGASSYSKDSHFTERPIDSPAEASSDTTFNHFALIGADWKKVGLHVGFLFPVIYLQNGNTAREAKPREAIPMARLSWTNESFKAQVSFGKGQTSVSEDVEKRATILNSDFENVSVDSFRFDFQFLRAGFTWNMDSEWELGADWLHWDWKYKDIYSGNTLEFDSIREGFLFIARKEFGDYVSLSVQVLSEVRKEKGNGSNGSYKNNNRPTSMGGALEFLF